MSRDLFARIALAQIPKILTLLDRNPHSPTYGCFDRNFWHYKIIDFPSGMSQEFVWPLALAYQTDLRENPFYQQDSIREWVEAGILYTARSAHPDGSCDDYFPYERAAGASAFSLLACVESYQLLELDNEEALKFFERRADWLAHHEESGQLTNHQALIVLCLELVGRLLQTSKWKRAKLRRFERVLEWQSEEGWFPEYEGCDPGYHSLTLWCLARLDRMRSPSDPRLKDALVRAVELASLFIHPDGSYGGEYSSRNTYNFFPHGFELAGRWIPKALAINDLFLQGLANGLAPCYADDHIIGHHTWNYLLAWQDYIEERPDPLSRPLGQIWLQEANLLIIRHPHAPVETIDSQEDIEETEGTETPKPASPEGTIELYVALNKGGTFKLFRDRQLVASDTQFSLQVRQGSKIKNAVGHLVDRARVSIENNEIILVGQLGWAKQQQMTPIKMMILRAVMLTGGRFFPNLIRKILQAMLITGKQDAPFHFTRTFRWEDGHWHVSDELFSQSKSWKKVVAAGIGCAQTSIYIVMSRTFQLGQLLPWMDLTDRVKELPEGESLRVERKL
ncbi:MAG: hypothetical protein SWY16_04945 [Cyanobacteriota bacterium]|nr:hypothetical protein [Cyanobacteriota bacterium]